MNLIFLNLRNLKINFKTCIPYSLKSPFCIFKIILHLIFSDFHSLDI